MLMVCMESVKEQASGAVNSNNLIYPILILSKIAEALYKSNYFPHCDILENNSLYQ